MNQKNKEKMVRVNTRIRQDQDEYIKAKSAQEDLYEGDVTRIMLDEYIKNHPLKKQKSGSK